MDTCPLPQSSCYLASSCFLQITTSPTSWSQHHCWLPWLALLTEQYFLDGFHQGWKLLSSSLQLLCFPPDNEILLQPCLEVLRRSAGALVFSQLTHSLAFIFNAKMLPLRSVLTSSLELMKVGSTLFFTTTCPHWNPSVIDQQLWIHWFECGHGTHR